MIYDELFAPFIQRPEHFDTYVLPSEWPKIDFTSYRALLLTCKEVKEEATTHFEGHFVRDVMVFFDYAVDFRKFYFKLKKTRSWERLANMRACLHTLPQGIRGRIARERMPKPAMVSLADLHTENCCSQMLICNNDGPSQAPEWHRTWDHTNQGVLIGGNILDACPLLSYRTRGSAKVIIWRKMSRSGPIAKGIQPTTRELYSECRTCYVQTVVPISCLLGHEWVLLQNSSEVESVLDEEKKYTGGCLRPGAKEWEQELKEKYDLDA